MATAIYIVRDDGERELLGEVDDIQFEPVLPEVEPVKLPPVQFTVSLSATTVNRRQLMRLWGHIRYWHRRN